MYCRPSINLHIYLQDAVDWPKGVEEYCPELHERLYLVFAGSIAHEAMFWLLNYAVHCQESKVSRIISDDWWLGYIYVLICLAYSNRELLPAIKLFTQMLRFQESRGAWAQHNKEQQEGGSHRTEPEIYTKREFGDPHDGSASTPWSRLTRREILGPPHPDSMHCNNSTCKITIPILSPDPHIQPWTRKTGGAWLHDLESHLGKKSGYLRRKS